MGEPSISFSTKGIEDLVVPHQVDVDPLTGAAVITVPLPLTAGRAGFGPSLALNYSSSGGNSVYGVGWSLAGLPAVGLTAKRLPSYDGDDTYAAGSEELVPALCRDGAEWRPRVEESGEHWVHYYRSKVETGFVRFEKWVDRGSGRAHWRSRSRDNVLTVYGLRPDGTSRIAHPQPPERTFLWLAEAQYDGRGNAILYQYATEDATGVDLSHAAERHRVLHGAGFPQRYLKRILYGNTVPIEPTEAIPVDNEWLFEVVLDYGDHKDDTRPSPAPDQPWPMRIDPFSGYRPGFEVRTYRRCRRILMFHHFAEQLGEPATLVGEVAFRHRDDPAGSTLEEIVYTGLRTEPGSGEASQRSLPPLRFEYSVPTLGTGFKKAPESTLENLPSGLGDARYRWVDLHGEGLPGILTETHQAWYYKPNLGGGRFGPQTRIAEKPSNLPGTYALADFDRDGNLDLVVFEGRQAGYCEHDRDTGRWGGFQPFRSAPQIDSAGARAQWLDLDGDGLSDLVVSRQDRLTWYPCEGREGFGEPLELAQPQSHGTQGQAVTEDLDLNLLFADMSGDGLPDQVRVDNGCVEYWPQLGRGRWGDAVVMEGAPTFDVESEFDPARLRLVDLDGSGTADLVYLGRGELRCWSNAGGNRFVEGGCLTSLPYIDNLSSVQVLDFEGDGTASLVWSSPLPGATEAPLRFLRLTGGVTPRLLVSVSNSMGQEIRLSYSSSSRHYLRDQERGRGWVSKLPSHVTVVDSRTVIDHIGGSRLTSRYEYHDGYFDGEEREFRGFGLVDQYDAEVFENTGVSEERYTPPSLVRTWVHNGAPGWEARRARDFYSRDPGLALLPPPAFEHPELLQPGENEDGFRALAGQPIRQEVYAVDAAGRHAEHPYQVTQNAYRLRRLQPSTEHDDACFTFYASETLGHHYEQQAEDPRTVHELTLAVDPYCNPKRTCTVGYPRSSTATGAIEPQLHPELAASRQEVVNFDEPDRYEIGIPIESEELELMGTPPARNGPFTFEDLQSAVTAALEAPLAFDAELDPEADHLQARRMRWSRVFYWNAGLSAPRSFGEVGRPTLPHHGETACFTDALLDQAYSDRVDTAFVANEGGYVVHDGHAWQPSPTLHFLPAHAFYSLDREERPDGGVTAHEHDPYYLALTEVRDPLGNRVRAEIDYHQLAPWRITDPNDNVAEVLYDPLGMTVVTASQGTVADEGGIERLYGDDLLADYVVRPPPTVDDILAAPEDYLQNAGQFFCYDLDAAPLMTVSLLREELVHDGEGGGTPGGRIQVTVAYGDGFGRTLQAKLRVEPGKAVRRDAAGAVVIGGNGRPEEAWTEERWQVSGHTVYDNKQQPVRQYEPFFDTLADFTVDEELRTYGVSTVTRYDPLGRTLRVDLPNGTFTRVEVTPWEVRNFDPNDTVEESDYRVAREGLPSDAPERQALEGARRHADTPTIVRLDPLGREVEKVETAHDDNHRVTRSTLDSQGDVVAITDPRGLTAFEYRRDMAGRVLHEHSIDAGDRWTLPDVFDRPVHFWEGRGTHQITVFDTLDRPTSVFVENAELGLDHRVEEMVYGDDPSLTGAELLNARGQLITHRDQAGVLTLRRFEPGGKPLRSERRLRTSYTSEPDWRHPDAVDIELVPYTSETTYDALGRPRVHRPPDGTSRTFHYLRSGGVARVGVSTAGGAWEDQPVLAEAEYNARGQRVRSLLGNEVTTTYEYDETTFRLNRLTSWGNERLYQEIEHTYDPVGNIVHMVDKAQESEGARTDVLSGLDTSSRCEYEYDAFYQLERATGRVHEALEQHDDRSGFEPLRSKMKGTRHLHLNNGAAVERYRRTYDYDLSGNIQRVQHHGLSGTARSWDNVLWTSPTSNRSLPMEDPEIPLTDPESRFDANGNCRYSPYLRAIDWNYRNNIARAVMVDRSAEGGTNDAEYYVYGGDGMRVRKVHEFVNADGVERVEKIYLDGCEIKRIRLGDRITLERVTSDLSDGTGRIALLHQWRIGRETNDPSRMRAHYQLANHLGSTSLEVAEDGRVISYEEYFPFGGTAFMGGDDVREVRLKDYRYSGKERDDATGFYYYGYRYYAPWIGKWLSPDLIVPERSLNLYSFVYNNPVNDIDTVGLDGLDEDEVLDSLPDEMVEGLPDWFLPFDGEIYSADFHVDHSTGNVEARVYYDTGEASVRNEATFTVAPRQGGNAPLLGVPQAGSSERSTAPAGQPVTVELREVEPAVDQRDACSFSEICSPVWVLTSESESEMPSPPSRDSRESNASPLQEGGTGATSEIHEEGHVEGPEMDAEIQRVASQTIDRSVSQEVDPGSSYGDVEEIRTTARGTYRFDHGLLWSVIQEGNREVANPANELWERGVLFALATIGMPLAMVEEGVRGILNIPSEFDISLQYLERAYRRRQDPHFSQQEMAVVDLLLGFERLAIGVSGIIGIAAGSSPASTALSETRAGTLVRSPGTSRISSEVSAASGPSIGERIRYRASAALSRTPLRRFSAHYWRIRAAPERVILASMEDDYMLDVAIHLARKTGWPVRRVRLGALEGVEEFTYVGHGYVHPTSSFLGARTVNLGGVYGHVAPSEMARVLAQDLGYRGGVVRLVACSTGLEYRRGRIFGEELQIALSLRTSSTVVIAPRGGTGLTLRLIPVVQVPSLTNRFGPLSVDWIHPRGRGWTYFFHEVRPGRQRRLQWLPPIWR